MSLLTKVLQPAVNGAWAAKQIVSNSLSRSVSLTDSAGVQNLVGGRRSETGRVITDEDLMMTTPFFSGVRLITETIGSLPLHIMRKTDDIDMKAVDHPMYKVLKRRPNKYQTSSVFIESIAFSLVMWNQAYVRNDGFGSRGYLSSVPKASVTPEVYDEGRELRWRILNGRAIETLELGEIIPIDGFRWPGALEGMAISGYHKEVAALQLAAEKYAARFFRTGGRPTGVITTEQVLTKVQRDQMREAYRGLFQGELGQQGDIAVFEGGSKYNAISSSPEDSQFLQTRKNAVLDACRILRIPPHMLMEMGAATYGNAQENRREFVTFTLLPYLRRVEEAFNCFLLPERDQDEYYCRFNLDGLLRGDAVARAQYYHAGRIGGWLTQGEIRKHEDLPYKDGTDDLHVQLNMAPSNRLLDVLLPDSEAANDESDQS